MVRLYTTAALVLALAAGGQLYGDGPQDKPKDPPRHVEGVVKRVDTTDPDAATVTVTVRERRPTDKEDMFVEVDKDYTFRVTGSTRILALDGKPDVRGLKGLEARPRVRVEHRKDLALEVKTLPPK